jgi:hypothetical protein
LLRGPLQYSVETTDRNDRNLALQFQKTLMVEVGILISIIKSVKEKQTKFISPRGMDG